MISQTATYAAGARPTVAEKKSAAPYFYSLTIALLFLLSLFTDWYSVLGETLFLVVVFMMLDKLGKGVVLRETIAVLGLFVTILMPILGYEVYNQTNKLAVLWARYMSIPESTYFDYALPAMSGFVLMLTWPIRSKKVSDEGGLLIAAIDKAKARLKDMPRVGIIIIITGALSSFIAPFAPDVVAFVATLLFWSSFAGALYVYYTPSFKFKKIILWSFSFFIFVGALSNGMFTLVAYMGLTIFSFLFMGRKMALWKKVGFFFIGCFLLLLLQNVKASYRNYLWREGYAGNKALLFGSLIGDKLTSSADFLSQDAFFPIYYRTNQGYNVSLVMRRFPSRVPFDNGVNLSRSLAASFVPRVLWPDKPEAGGRFNMKYYTGITLFGGWSTNVGPLGEAYGSFGPIMGVVYMLALGFFIRWAYKRVFEIASAMPLLIVWLPVLFYQITYSAETDSLQIFNSLIKSAFFVWIISRILPTWLGMERKKTKRRREMLERSRMHLTQ